MVLFHITIQGRLCLLHSQTHICIKIPKFDLDIYMICVCVHTCNFFFKMGIVAGTDRERECIPRLDHCLNFEAKTI
uniref:Uncharacterized protein n=1 Tax=Rhizophora mucronata TaxID=61149 RepID=A0A2P2MXB8_RHIMU